jgi:type I restriction enzyme S subunit
MTNFEWREVALGQICEFKYGKSLPASEREPGVIGVYGSNGLVGTHSSAVTNGPTIVIGRKGSFGEVAYSEGSCWPIDTTYYVDSSCTTVDLRWLYYRLGCLGLKKLNRAAAIPGLNREDAYRRRLLLPSVREQRRIAEMLDQADALLAKSRQSVALFDDLGRSIFFQMFGDLVSNENSWPVGPVSTIVKGFESGKSLAEGPDDTASRYRILKISAVTSGRFKPQESKPAPEGYEPPKSHFVRGGDLLFSRANTSELIGATAFVPSGTENLLMPDKLWRFVWNDDDKNKPSPWFVYYVFRQPSVRDVIRRNASGSSGSMKNISQNKVLSMKIGIPSAPLQDEFERKILEVEALRQSAESEAVAFDDLFSSLQARAFSGKL